MPYLHSGQDLGTSRASVGAADSVRSNMEVEVQKGARNVGSCTPADPKQDQGMIVGVESATKGASVGECKGGEAMEGVEYASCAPSPSSAGAPTRKLRREPCPLRLRSLVPPPNYGCIKDDKIFRSGFLQDKNMEFIETMSISTVLCLVDTEPSDAYNRWIQDQGIKRLRVDITPNKDGKVKTTADSLCEAVLVMMDCAYYPLYIHCNQGRHRTGCIVACFRKVQRWPIEAILAEYDAYANPKARSGDVELIRAFDPECVFDYAKVHGYLDEGSPMRRMDSTITNVDALAQALASKMPSDDFGMDISGISGLSNASTASDDGLEMTRPAIDPLLLSSEQVKLSTLDRDSAIDDSEPIEVNGHVDDMEGALEATHIEGVDPSVAVPEAQEATTTVVELSEEAMTPPATIVSNPFG